MVKGKVRIAVCLVVILANILKSVTCERNVAESKPANQSSGNTGKWVASNVVDGCTKTDIGSNCCTHTDNQGPKTVWWQVDLVDLMTINSITIYYRDDFQLRLAGYHLYISNTTSTPQDGVLCYVDTINNKAAVQLTITHQCPYVGRYVTVYNYRNTPTRYDWYDQYAVLELCEVQVWGCPVRNYGDGNCDNACSGDCYGGNCNATTGACFYCIPQKYGTTCDQDCSVNCLNQICNRVSGHCNDCIPQNYGTTCDQDCSINCLNQNCNRVTGHCTVCNPGGYGNMCNQRCSQNCSGTSCERITGNCISCVSGTYGAKCENSCSVNCNGMMCDRNTGHCTDCNPGWYGDMCNQRCSQNCNGTSCERITGNCFGCVPKRYGNTCDMICSSNCNGTACGRDDGHCLGCVPNQYGNTCDMNCSANCNGTTCGRNDGHCLGCEKGSYGIDCSMACDNDCLECDQQNGECTECAAGLYGKNCSLTCEHCSSCQIYSGVCVTPCDDGYQGDLCATRQVAEPGEPFPSADVGPIVAAVVWVIVVGVVTIVIVIFIRRRRLNAERQKPFSDIGESNNLYLKPESKNRRSGVTDSNIYSNISEQEEPSEAGASVYVNAGLVGEASGSGDVYYNSGPIGFPISELKSIIETKMQNKAKAFEDEYKSIPSGALHKHTTGTLDHNKVKNRFKTTFPYDHSRVILDIVGKDPHSDYINANYIDNVIRPAVYVATQGPRPGTVNDFWRMIWQLQTGKIVMLTNLVEGGKPKCDKYWPNEGEKPLDAPHFNIVLERERAYAFYVIRDFKVTDKKTKTVRQVHQFHYTTWPDHGTPDPNELVVFHRRVKNYEAVMEGRMVVHCSAGIGRTGTFIALDALLEYGKATKRIDVLQYIKTMRKDRVNMVQTAEQYIAVHQLLIEAFDMPDTLIPRMTFHTELSALFNGGPTNQTKLRQEYQMTQSTKPNYGETDYRAALLPSNKMKNMTLSVLAADRFRTYLQSQSSRRTDYINAVMLPSYTSKTGYIVTQTPLEDTVVDLLTMIMDHNCHTLVTIDTDPIEWLPRDDEFQTFSSYRLEYKGHSSTIECLDLHDIEIENLENNTSINLRVFHMTGWDRNTPVPKDSAVLLQLLELVDSRRKSDDAKITIVMCRDGYSQSGLFCCISNARDQMKCDEEVDIYQISRQLLVRRPEVLTNFDQYQCCYTMLRDYLDTDDVYIN